MSNNEELILGLCPLPGNEESQLHESQLHDVVENATIVKKEEPLSPSPNCNTELEACDVDEYKEPDDIKVAVSNDQALMAPRSSVPNSIDIVIAEAISDSLPEESCVLDYTNHTEGESIAVPILADADSERPAKRRRQTLPKGTFQCAECRSLLESFDVYSAHMNTHSAVPLFTCPKCLYIFQDQSLFEAHTAQICRAAGNAKDKECAVCLKTFKYDSHLREHIICMHNKTPLFSCPICGQNITSWRRSIDRHMTNHSNQIKCPTCGLKGENTHVVDAHIIEAGPNHLKCKSCTYTSSSRLEFFCHVNVHIPKVDLLEPMVCYKCSHRFQRTSEFNNHVRFFCKFREGHVLNSESEPESTQSVQHQSSQSIPELHVSSTNESPGVISIANDPSKQIITLPEGANNNTFIPITVTTGNDEMGQGLGPNTTVILIPQILLMPGNASGIVQDGTSEIIASGQNDQVIYLECLKPDSGMFPMYEMTGDGKNIQDNLFVNQVPPTDLPQTIVQHSDQTVQNIKTEQESEASDVKVESFSVPVSENSSNNSPNSFSVTLPPASTETLEVSGDNASSQEESVGPPALVCSVCNEVLRDSETYENHVKQHDKAKIKPRASVVINPKKPTSFKCEECSQGFAAKHHLEQHTITFHSDVAGIVCPVCRVGMASEKTSLNEHLAKVHKLRVEPSGKLTECTES